MTATSARDRYQQLSIFREPYLRRARQLSQITIPTLILPEGWDGNTDLYQPYSEASGRLVTTLSSRMMLALMPAGFSFFKFSVSPEALVASGSLEEDQDTTKSLAMLELFVNSEIERKRWRSPTYQALEHLIVAGNVMDQIKDDNKVKLYRLDQYCVVRDSEGEMKEFVIEERMDDPSLDDSIRDQIQANAPMSGKPHHLYTWGVRQKEGGWKIHQEIEDKVMEAGEFKVCPFRALMWEPIVGEPYGRSKCELHSGGLLALEALEQAMIEGAAMAARHIVGVNPGAGVGTNLRRKIAEASNGDVLVFEEGAVHTVTFDNHNGLAVIQAEIERLTRELSIAFLSTSGATRDAERVTQEEIRRNAAEVDAALGGVMATLAEDMLLHRINRLLINMKSSKSLPPDLPDDLLNPTITTGVEALSRNAELNKVAQVLQFLQGIPPEIAQSYVQWTDLLNKVFQGAGLPGSVRTDAEAQQILLQQQASQSLGNSAGKVAEQASAGQQAQA